MLLAIAKWLESPENEALLLAEDDNDSLDIVATSCVAAATILKNAAVHLQEIEPYQDVGLTTEHLTDLANLATKLDSSDDVEMQKQASVLDQLLLTLAASPVALKEKKAQEDKRLDEIKKKYQESKDRFHDLNKLTEAAKDVEKHPAMKEYTILEHALQTRTCPDHPGAQMQRVGEGSFQCSLDKRIYNYEGGYTLLSGEKVPGGSVQNQTKLDTWVDNSNFETRESKTGV